LVIICLFAVDASAHPGWAIIMDRNGEIYFGDVETNTIGKFNRERRLETIATGKQLYCVEGLRPGQEIAKYSAWVAGVL